MVGRKALGLVSVALVALSFAFPATAQNRASSGLAGLTFPTQSRDWSSDPGGFKGASLDLAAALTGKECGAEEFHVWSIADFAAGVTLSEAVDEAFRAAGWRLDLISRDSELSRIYLASRGDDALILDWLPEEGVVGLLICAAAEPGSQPAQVAQVEPERVPGFSLVPGAAPPPVPPIPRPAPRGDDEVAADSAVADTAPETVVALVDKPEDPAVPLVPEASPLAAGPPLGQAQPSASPTTQLAEAPPIAGRTPIDLGMTAAIAEPTAAEPAAGAGAPGPRVGESISEMYERVPPPAGLVNPRSVVEQPPSLRPGAPRLPATGAPTPALAQIDPPAPASPAVGRVLAEEPVPVSTVLAPAVDRSVGMWPLFLLAVILAGAGLAILLRRQATHQVPASAAWPTALATVVGANLDERVGDAGIQFTPVLRYRFAVGENEFEATTEGWGGHALATRAAAESVLARFPDHAHIEISYDPTDPTRVALPETHHPFDPMLILASACLGLAALTLVLTLV